MSPILKFVKIIIFKNTHTQKSMIFYQEKEPTPLCNFKILELIIDMIVYCTVNNKQLNTLSWVLCIKIKTLSLRGLQLISVSFGTC